jgi:hypothetical protein
MRFHGLKLTTTPQPRQGPPRETTPDQAGAEKKQDPFRQRHAADGMQPPRPVATHHSNHPPLFHSGEACPTPHYSPVVSDMVQTLDRA